MSATEPLAPLVEHLFRRQAGQMVASLTRVFGIDKLDLVEDVVQDALLLALRRWPYQGIPDNPAAWLVKVARNRALDVLRRGGRWERRRQALERELLAAQAESDGDARFARELDDDQLRLMFACCHPALSREAQVTLTLKTVCGFGVSEIARAFLSKQPTVAQRLVRAKRKLRELDAAPEIPAPDQLAEHLDAVLQVIYLLFNEGYSAHEGEDLVRADLCGEASRLCGLLARHPVVAGPKVHALAALLLFQAARLPARADGSGELLLLAEQDRSLWDRRLLGSASAHLRQAGRGRELSSYHLEAEIAACHALSPSYQRTDWARILHCYDTLLELNPSPVVALNRVIAFAEVHGASAGLATLSELEHDPALAQYYPLHATRGELLRRLQRFSEAEREFQHAMVLTASQPVRRFLSQRAGACAAGDGAHGA